MREYELIKAYYGDRRAKRSGLPLINHIDEGVNILQQLGATYAAVGAYCLHPLFQADEDLAKHAGLVFIECLDPWVMTLVMEYRHKANAWLSDKVENHSVYSYSDAEPKLVKAEYRCNGAPSPGPLPEVKHMLIADKVQNYKDFCIYHSGSHKRSDELHIYFKEWLRVLEVDQQMYEKLISGLQGS